MTNVHPVLRTPPSGPSGGSDSVARTEERRTPSEDVRRIKAYLDGYGSGLQHAQDYLGDEERSEEIQAEVAAIDNITWFLIEEFGEFE